MWGAALTGGMGLYVAGVRVLNADLNLQSQRKIASLEANFEREPRKATCDLDKGLTLGCLLLAASPAQANADGWSDEWSGVGRVTVSRDRQHIEVCHLRRDDVTFKAEVGVGDDHLHAG